MAKPELDEKASQSHKDRGLLQSLFGFGEKRQGTGVHEMAGQISQARQEIDALHGQLAQREQEMREQLSAAQRQAEEEKAALAASHAESERRLRGELEEREQALAQQLRAAQAELHRLEQEWASREKELSEQASQSRKEPGSLLRSLFGLAEKPPGAKTGARQNPSAPQGVPQETTEEQAAPGALRESLAQLEQTLVQHLQTSNQEILRQQQQEQTAKIGTLHNLVESLKDDIQSLRDAQQSLSQQYGLDLSDKEAKIERLKNSFTELEARLNTKISLDQQAGLRLQQSLADLRTGLEGITPAVRGLEAPAISETADAAHTLDELLSCHDRRFVLCAFRTLLDRTPDPEGLNYYLGRLRTGFSKILILKQLRDSEEFFIRNAYRISLGRFPDPEVLDLHLRQARAGTSKKSFLRQLRKSPEAESFLRLNKGKPPAELLPGLDKAIRNHQRGRLPLIGWIVRLLLGAEGNSPSERKWRAIENQLALLSEERDRQFKQMENAFIGFHQLVARQARVITEVLDSTNLVSIDIPATSVTSPPDPEGLQQLPQRARNIYFQLKNSATMHQASLENITIMYPNSSEAKELQQISQRAKYMLFNLKKSAAVYAARGA